MNSKSTTSASILESFKVLDLTDEKGMLCGKFLASIGAEVIKIEPPGGDRARNLPPFVNDTPGPGMSLYYAGYNTNKKSITLNIETEDGREIFKKLVKDSDFVIESFSPGYMRKLGLGYPELSAINPRIIMTSITPFGQEGPYSQYKPSDLMCFAMSGLMYLVGDPDGTPLRISVPQSYSLGAAEGFGSSMIAHYYRERTGEGQYVDVSIRDSMIKTTIGILPECEVNDRVMKRGGAYWVIRHKPNKMLWACKDGWITFRLHGGTFALATNRQLVKWMSEENMADDFMLNVDWENLDMDQADDELHRKFEEPVGKFFMSHTRQELFEGALARNIMLLPVSTVEEVANSPQLEFREYWDEVDQPGWDKGIKYPGAFIKASETPCVKTQPASSIGEHNEDIYKGRLGFSNEKLALLKTANVI
ncbi:MAG: CoA transferase [Deltaproteobacteria bacterium]|nr:CoA transferase [Deltaproteobacteria bacterium]